MKLTVTLLLCALATSAATAQTISFSIERLGSELTGKDVLDLETSGSKIYAAADTNGVFVLDAAQQNPEWRLLGLEGQPCTRFGVSPRNPLVMLALLDGDVRGIEPGLPADAILRSDDGGATWVASDAGIDTTRRITPRLVRFSPHDPLLVVALFSDYYREVEIPPYVSRDGGRTWTPLEGTMGFTLFDVAFDPVDSLQAYAVAVHELMGAAFLKSLDGGVNWSLQSVGAMPGTRAMTMAINPLDADRALVSADFDIYVSSDRGGSWDPAKNVPVRPQLVWDGRDTSMGFAAGSSTDRTIVAATTDYGTTWSDARIDSLAHITSVAVSPAFARSVIVSSIRTGFTDGQPGVFRVTANTTTAVRRETASGRHGWFDSDGFHIRAEAPVAYRLHDVTGRVVGSGVAQSGTVSIDNLPPGPYWLVTSDGRVVRGMR